MTQPVPVRYTEIVNLQTLGIASTSIGFSTVTLQSDKFVCIREKLNDKAQLAIVELEKVGNIIRRNMTADSAIMNPSSKIVALKAEKALQVFNLELKAKVASHVVNDDVVFWRWINSDIIAFVCGNTLYHWRVTAGTPPEKIFALHSTLASSKIINYHVDHSMKWLVLIGVLSNDGKITGAMQLFSVEKDVSQLIVGHAATFAHIRVGENNSPSNIFIFASRDDAGGKVHMIEVGQAPPENQVFSKRFADMIYQPDAVGDFPIAIHADNTSGVFYVITKSGYIYLYDLEAAKCFYATKISPDVVFATTSTADFGFVAINREGSIFSVRLEPANVLPYLKSRSLEELGFRIAERCGFPGAEAAITTKFNILMQQGKYEDASKLAARSGNILRTTATIQIFQSINVPAGSPSPLLHYFGALLETGKLNKHESIELAKPVVYQGKKNLIEKWLKEERLDCSEELGDIVKTLDVNLSLSIYLRCQANEKVIQCFAETGQYQKIILYVKKVDAKVDYVSIIAMIMRSNPDAAIEFAKQILAEDPTNLNVTAVSDLFFQHNYINQGTNFLLEYLKGDRPEDEALQTKLLELNIKQAPQVADAIFQNAMFSHYDRAFIARICEQAGMMQRALEHFTDIYDIKRAIVHTHLFNPEWFVNFFGTLSVDDSLDCLSLLLDSNIRQNLQLCVSVAQKYYEQLGVKQLIKLFENVRSSEGLFMFLGGIVNFSQEEEVHFKYIQSAAKIGQIKEVERICRESNYYNPEKVKDFLKEAKISDHLPMIIVCDRFNMLQDLVLYLYKCNALSYIEMYVQKYNASRLPKMVGSLLDIDIGDDFIQNMIVGVPDQYSIEDLVEEVSSRNRMKLLRPVLENRLVKGSTDASIHSALAMVYIDGNNNPEKFLKENQHYDARMVGRFCEKRNVQLSFQCYEKGLCYDELLDLSYKHSLFKNLARFLVEKRDEALWTRVLDNTNEYRRQLMDQVIQNVLPECTNPEDVSVTVKCFMKCDVPNELVELLDKLVMHNTIFSNHRNLQNLLILTAIKADKTRVMDYVTRLDNYDAPDIATIAMKDGLLEEAFCIYKKFNVNTSALAVLTDNMNNFVRAYEFAERVNEVAVWALLAKSQIREGLVREAIESSIKANDYSSYHQIISSAKKVKEWNLLRTYLLNARKEYTDSVLDTQYAYTLVQLEEMETLEKFLQDSTQVNLVTLGDICFEEEYYEAARILYTNSSQFPKLALALLKLENYSAAVECARKGNNIKTWREVCFACVEKKEFKYAQVCALNLVVNPEELFDLIRIYERFGFFGELIGLLESSVGLERAHMGLFTELAIAYCKYKPSKLKEHLELFFSRINLPKVMGYAEKYHLWPELVYLYEKYDEADNALRTVMSHPVESFNANHFKDIASKVANVELLYKAILFYIENSPALLNDLMIILSGKLDPTRVVKMISEAGYIHFIKPYLEHVQKVNLPVVNEALNNLYEEEGLYEELSISVDKYRNFDMVAFAQKLENHELIEFRRVSNQIYKICNRWQQSIELAKKDALDIDAIVYACESRDTENVRKLLIYFCEQKKADSVVKLLYHCYDLVKAEDVLQYCFINGLVDYSMPYFVQLLHDILPKIQDIQTKVDSSTDSAAIKEQPSMIMKPQLMLTEQMQRGQGAGVNPPGFGSSGYRGF